MGGDLQNIVKPRRDGLDPGEYDSVMFEGAIAGVKGSLRGLKKGYPAVRTSVNFSWWHTALLYAMPAAGCRFDVIGIDWYSDAEEVSDISELLADVCAHIPAGQYHGESHFGFIACDEQGNNRRPKPVCGTDAAAIRDIRKH